MAIRRIHNIERARAAYRANKYGTSVESELKRPTLFTNQSTRFPHEHVRNKTLLGKLPAKTLWLIRFARIKGKQFFRARQRKGAS